MIFCTTCGEEVLKGEFAQCVKCQQPFHEASCGQADETCKSCAEAAVVSAEPYLQSGDARVGRPINRSAHFEEGQGDAETRGRHLTPSQPDGVDVTGEAHVLAGGARAISDAEKERER